MCAVTGRNLFAKISLYFSKRGSIMRAGDSPMNWDAFKDCPTFRVYRHDVLSLMGGRWSNIVVFNFGQKSQIWSNFVRYFSINRQWNQWFCILYQNLIIFSQWTIAWSCRWYQSISYLRLLHIDLIFNRKNHRL